MNYLWKLADQIEQAHKNFPNEVAKIIKDNEKEILDLNKQQLFAGVNSEGVSLGKYKNRKYAALKAMLNPNRVIDLFRTGKFYERFFLRTYKLPLEIDSKDEKRNLLVARFTEKIFGLNKESQKLLAKSKFAKAIIEYWKKAFHV
jgi:hypothetical protein